MDSNHRRRTPADLQSAPFGHSGISPKLNIHRLFAEIVCKITSFFHFHKYFSKNFMIIFIISVFQSYMHSFWGRNLLQKVN